MPTNWTNTRRTTNTRTGWGSTPRSRGAQTGWGTVNSGRTTSIRTAPGVKCAPGYSSIYNNFSQKLQSIKTLCNQATGPAKGKRPSPTTLTTFANWLNKGCNVCTLSNTQVQKWAYATGQNFSPNSITNAKNVLWTKFGKNAIKAVTCDKNGGFLVACAPTVNGRPFIITPR